LGTVRFCTGRAEFEGTGRRRTSTIAGLHARITLSPARKGATEAQGFRALTG
jgi:hypothetical protein